MTDHLHGDVESQCADGLPRDRALTSAASAWPARKRPFQFSLRALLFGVVLVALCCGGPIQFVRWMWPDPRGPVTSRDKWPVELTGLVDSASRAGVVAEPSQVYCVRSFMMNQEHYWTMPSSPALLSFITKEWGLTRIGSDNPLVSRFWADMPTRWYPTDGLNHAEYSASPPRVAGGDSGLVVLYDKDRDTIVVWCEWIY